MAKRAKKEAGKTKEVKAQTKAAKSVPLCVKIISVLNYIGVAVALLISIALFFAAGFADTIAEVISQELPELSGAGPLITTGGIIGGIVALAFAVLSFFIGRGLWKGQQWARIIEIIFSIVGVLLNLISLFQGEEIASSILFLLINGIIGGYLLFNENVKAAFA